MADSHTRWIIKDYLFFPSAMSWLITFLAIWPIALSVLLRFAARIDPRSGRWRHW
ncbi:hypothetical protein [Paraburkholderia metrosideri]|uniref:hypothetical protein n=1 Tax=Paraburkholderia metrosideri TaxID=580937 RepID=UPI001F1ED6AC|nr:hypothetical protein [Paraburkholderia metrosideri]